jgi:hypothetical protein
MPRSNYYTILFEIFLILGVILLPACSQGIPAPSQDESTSLPTEGSIEQMTPTHSTPEDAHLQSLIESTKVDLANRVAITTDKISLVEITEVEWSDSSLDCPQPGMDYLQVITPGYRILLEAGGQSYEYHTNRDAYFVYCENKVPPLIPKP